MPYLRLIADHCPIQDGTVPLGAGRTLPGADLLADTVLTPHDAPGAVLLARAPQPGFFVYAPASAPAWRVLAVPLRTLPGSGPAGALSVAGPRDELDTRQEELLTAMHDAVSTAASAAWDALVQAA
ncbi:hypothetical protein [Streptomyces nanshensis]|uniref:hypothetical protein n=1 Tax=Streptomyces nanshensis TaxID=518642 RepID=UPI00085C4F77|nr:hypothetical protein [Streptomyces nanshensis]